MLLLIRRDFTVQALCFLWDKPTTFCFWASFFGRLCRVPCGKASPFRRNFRKFMSCPRGRVVGPVPANKSRQTTQTRLRVIRVDSWIVCFLDSENHYSRIDTNQHELYEAPRRNSVNARKYREFPGRRRARRKLKVAILIRVIVKICGFQLIIFPRRAYLNPSIKTA